MFHSVNGYLAPFTIEPEEVILPPHRGGKITLLGFDARCGPTLCVGAGLAITF
ncbi:MAG: hypothetical protein ACTS2F_04215 [Thainema sp.]